jgi:hypothetical protein
VTFPNRDTYFGGYAGGAKSGLGLYAFATGAAYLGQYKEVRGGWGVGQCWPRSAAERGCAFMPACLPECM